MRSAILGPTDDRGRPRMAQTIAEATTGNVGISNCSYARQAGRAERRRVCSRRCRPHSAGSLSSSAAATRPSAPASPLAEAFRRRSSAQDAGLAGPRQPLSGMHHDPERWTRACSALRPSWGARGARMTKLLLLSVGSVVQLLSDSVSRVRHGFAVFWDEKACSAAPGDPVGETCSRCAPEDKPVAQTVRPPWRNFSVQKRVPNGGPCGGAILVIVS
jgi:hypothetical protein